MDQPELVARLLTAFEAEFRRHIEIDRPLAEPEFIRGKIAPGLLQPVLDNDLDTQHRLRNETRTRRATVEGQPVTSTGQAPERPEQQCVGPLTAANGNAAISMTLANPPLFEAMQHPPLA